MAEPRVILITGSRTGIGRRLAEHYAGSGQRVVGCSRAPFEGELDNYVHHRLDVADEMRVKELFRDLQESYGRLDLLLNCAGATALNHALLTPLDTVQRVLQTNFCGTFLFCREAAKLMMRARRGHIINFSTIHVPLATVGASIYAASKSAVEQFTRIFGKEVAHAGVSVHCLGLPFVKESTMMELVAPDVVTRISQLLAHQNPLEIAELVKCIDALAALPPGVVTGQTVYLGGV